MKKTFLKLFSLILVLDIVLQAPIVSRAESDTVYVTSEISMNAGVSNLDFLYSIRDKGYSIYNIKTNKDMFLYSDRSLQTKTRFGIKAGVVGKFKILDVSKLKKSVKVTAGNRTGWFPISFFTPDINIKCYPYQLTETISCYSIPFKSTSSGKIGKVKPIGTVGTSENDIWILSTSDSYVRVAIGGSKLICYVLKSELYSNPLDCDRNYLICPQTGYTSPIYIGSSYSSNEARLYLTRARYYKATEGTYIYTVDQDCLVYVTYNDGWYQIKKYSTNFCFDVKGGESKPETALQLYYNNNTAAQDFQIFKKDNKYYIHSRLGTYVDIKGGHGFDLQLYTGNNTSAQWWTFIAK